jgi:Gpi18-like mannosyltransferase
MQIHRERTIRISKHNVFCAALAAILLLWLGTPNCAEREANLLPNGDLSSANNHLVTGWHGRVSAFDKTRTTFGWDRLPGGGGEIVINNDAPTLAAWQHELTLSPGWYRLSAEAMVTGGWIGGGGAVLGVQTIDGLKITSRSVFNAPSWTEIELYLREDTWDDTNAIFCQLGQDELPEAGRAAFRNVQVVRITSPPPGTQAEQFDLTAIRRELGSKTEYADPFVRAVGKLCAFALLGLITWALVAIWRPGFSSAGQWTHIAVTVMLAITVVKIASLFYFTGYYWDIYSKTKRALVMAGLGPARIYAPGMGVDAYPPASVYLLWLSGWLGRALRPGGEVLRVIVETPPLIADLLIGLTIFFAATLTRGPRIGMVAMLLFALNPALIFDTVVWGQSDSVVALAMLVAILLVLMKQTRLGWCAAAIGVLSKPQAFSMLPPLALWTVIDVGIAESAVCAALFIATIVLGILPYQIGHPLNWMLLVYRDLANRYPGASMGAFNFLGLIGGIGKSETDTFGGVSYFLIGIALASAAYAVSALMVLRARRESGVMTAIFVALFGFFMFLPRMHQRYMYYSLVLLALLAVNSRCLGWIFGALTASFLANLIYSKHLIDISSFPEGRLDFVTVTAGLVNVAAFFAVVYWGLFIEPGEDPASQPALHLRDGPLEGGVREVQERRA